MKLLAIGAHYDDCIFGIPGILLRAVDQGHQATILSVIGDYRNWAPVGEERQGALTNGMRQLCEEKGIETRFLNYQSMAFGADESSKRAVAKVVAEVEPDVGFLMWPKDSHPDHEVVSQLSKVAFNFSKAILGAGKGIQPPQRLYYYDNGPRHTDGFEPDTFVDIGDYASEALDWLDALMVLAHGPNYDRNGGPVEGKKVLAAYRGLTCAVQYAEALKSFVSYPTDIL
jgi:N-acetylglucosamine malate deacetylase 1